MKPHSLRIKQVASFPSDFQFQNATEDTEFTEMQVNATLSVLCELCGWIPFVIPITRKMFAETEI